MDMPMFIVSGLLGGVASALLWARSWQDLKKYDVFRAIVLGAIGGYLYWLMRTEWSVPDGVMAFFFGYAFQDIIEAIAEKVKQRILRVGARSGG
jgi:4-amino-4-deoxy-L-arabinose transferase-like glycosyltransferase